jgi:hypothetical protein
VLVRRFGAIRQVIIGPLLTESGTLAAVEGHDTFSGQGSNKTSGSLAVVEGHDTFTGQGSNKTTGSLAATESHDVFAGFSSGVAAILAAVESHDIFSGHGVNNSPALLAAIESHDVFAAAGTSTGGTTGATLSGPTTGILGVISTYTITPNVPYTGLVSLADSSNQGTLEPPVLFFYSTSTSSQKFNYIPNTTGSRNISASGTNSLSILGSPIALSVSYPVATSLVITPPAQSYAGGILGKVGQASQNFTVTPNGLYTGTVSLFDLRDQFGINDDGTFTPSTLTFINSSTPQTFTYTPSSVGNKLILIRPIPGITTTGRILIAVPS